MSLLSSIRKTVFGGYVTEFLNKLPLNGSKTALGLMFILVSLLWLAAGGPDGGTAADIIRIAVEYYQGHLAGDEPLSAADLVLLWGTIQTLIGLWHKFGKWRQRKKESAVKAGPAR